MTHSPRTETRCTELLVPGPAEALARLLDVPLPLLEVEGVPLGWHWVYLLDRPAQHELAVDGHPAAGITAPPEPDWRRMWAGGSLRCEGALRIGEQTVRRSRLTSSTDKEGRSGRLRIVEVTHEISQRGAVVVRERQDIVYRAPASRPTSAAAGPQETVPTQNAPAVGGLSGWRVSVDPTLLFRFSALTYNAHRIHYDREYATLVEGYPGLLVHGPLQALAMAERVRAAGIATQPGVVFDYRLEAPLFDHQGMRVMLDPTAGAIDGLRSWIEDDDGRRTASAIVRTPGQVTVKPSSPGSAAASSTTPRITRQVPALREPLNGSDHPCHAS